VEECVERIKQAEDATRWAKAKYSCVAFVGARKEYSSRSRPIIRHPVPSAWSRWLTRLQPTGKQVGVLSTLAYNRRLQQVTIIYYLISNHRLQLNVYTGSVISILTIWPYTRGSNCDETQCEMNTVRRYDPASKRLAVKETGWNRKCPKKIFAVEMSDNLRKDILLADYYILFPILLRG